jgi:tetratricopeptide (TPR) repeat protein
MRAIHCLAIIVFAFSPMLSWAEEEAGFALQYERQNDANLVKNTSDKKEEQSLRAAFKLLLNHATDEAIESFEKLKQRMPEDPLPLYGLALAQQKKGNASLAQNYYRAVVEHRAATPMLRQHAAINYAMGAPQSPQSFQFLHRLYKEGNTSAALLAAIAQVCWKNGKIVLAKDFFQRAANSNREQASLYYYNLGVLSDQTGARIDAKRYYQLALNNPVGLNLLALEEQEAVRKRLAWLEQQ